MHKKFEFEYEELDSKEALVAEDLALLNAAFQAVETAFAPYSKFKVGAAVRLSNGQILLGSNQESASYPVGICAERTLLNSIGSQYPNETIQAMAISYIPNGVESDHPLSPCGMCRQSLLDFEIRYKRKGNVDTFCIQYYPIWIYRGYFRQIKFVRQVQS
jgi:cytidine deaminase